MRPYLALIKDSFRAAIASSVLYVLLAVITLLLLALAPLHVREVLDWKIRFGQNVTKTDELAERLVERGEDPDEPAINRVWELLSAGMKADLKKTVAKQKKQDAANRKAADGDSSDDEDARRANVDFMERRRFEGDFEKELNEIIERKDFYLEEAWASKRLNPEARDLLAEEPLSDERSRRLNRLLMASATGGIIERGSGNALELWYGPWWEINSFAISFNEFANATLSTVTWFFDKFVMSIGLFIAILVTANFIPETFLPGSLNLLLSKPISRWGLLLSKFAGGCAFVTLCAVYLFVGLWVWLGFGMGIWDRGILWAIPLYIVVFAIYYSVSTLIGVWSRSPILSIIVTALFWALCFAVGLSHQMIDGRLSNSRTRGLVAVKDNVLHVGELNTVSTWDESGDEWKKALEIKMMEEQRIAMGAVMFVPGAGDDGDLNTIGPIYDPKHDVVLSGVINLGNPTTMNHQDLFVASADKLEFEEVGKLPKDAIEAVSDDEGVIVFTRFGRFWRYAGKDDEGNNDKESASKSADGSASSSEPGEKKSSGLENLVGSLFGKKKSTKNDELFKSVGPDERVEFLARDAVTYNSKLKSAFILDGETIKKFVADENGKFVKNIEKKLESSKRAIIESAGQTLVAVFPNGTIQTFDADSLEELKSYKPQEKSPFIAVQASNDGRYFSFRCRDKTLWLLDLESPDQIKLANISGQESVTANAFDDQDRLWVATSSNRVQLYDLSNSKRLKSLAPATGWLTKFYEYGLNPVYRFFPKPGEFYRLVAHLSANPSDAEQEIDLGGLSTAADPWEPLWGGLLFMCAILTVTGLIFQFRDF